MSRQAGGHFGRRSRLFCIACFGLFILLHSTSGADYGDGDFLAEQMRQQILNDTGVDIDDLFPMEPSAVQPAIPPPRNNAVAPMGVPATDTPYDAPDNFTTDRAGMEGWEKFDRIPGTPIGDESLQRARHERLREQARERLSSRLDQSPVNRTTGSPRIPTADEYDQLLRKLETDARVPAGSPGKLRDIDRKRLAAILFYHQPVYRRAVAEGRFPKDSPRVKAFLELKKEFQADVLQRTGMLYKRQTGLIPNQPVVQFDYNDIFSDDDVITGTGDAGRTFQAAYDEALSEIMQERTSIPMTAADRKRIDVNGVAWNMTTQGGLQDFNHPERYINPQSAYANEDKLVSDAQQGRVSGYTYDHNGKLVKLDNEGTVAMIKRLEVEKPLEIPGLDSRNGTGKMSDFLRMASLHQVKGTNGRFTTDDVIAFIRNQKYSERTHDVLNAVFDGDLDQLREYENFMRVSREIRSGATVTDVARTLNNAYGVTTIRADGSIDWDGMTEAMVRHQNLQVQEILPRMIENVSNSEAGKIASWLRTASAADRRLLRKQMALTYAPMDEVQLERISKQLDGIPMNAAERQFLQDILSKDTRQLRGYADTLEMGIDKLTSLLHPSAQRNMAVVDFLSANAKVRPLTHDIPRRKGGLRFQQYVFDKTARALNMDVMLDQVTGPRILQGSLLALSVTRAFNAANDNIEAYKNVLMIGLEMIPGVAAVLRTSEGEYREAMLEVAMEVFPPLALAQLAFTVTGATVEYARSEFDETVWDGLAREALSFLDEGDFERGELESYYRLRDRMTVFSFIDEAAPGFGRITKLASMVEPEVEARLSQTDEYRINREALRTLQWFKPFDENGVSGQVEQALNITQLRTRVYENGVPGFGEASPVERVAARILADELRLRKEIYQQVLHDFIDRIENLYNDGRASDSRDPAAIVLDARDRLKEIYDEFQPEFSESEWASKAWTMLYRDRMELIFNYNQNAKPLIEVKRDLDTMLSDFRQSADWIRNGLNLFVEQRQLGLQVHAYGGDRAFVQDSMLLIGDVFRLGISGRVSPRRGGQAWTAYYYVRTSSNWELLGEKRITASRFNPRNDGLWLVTEPEKETFLQITPDQVAAYFDKAQGYYQVRAVLAFGEWPSDPVSVIGMNALEYPLDNYQAFGPDRVAFASPVLELFATEPRVRFDVPRALYLGEQAQAVAAVALPAYALEETQEATVTLTAAPGDGVHVQPTAQRIASNPETPTPFSIQVPGDAVPGTYYLQLEVRLNRLSEKYQPFRTSTSFTLVDQEQPDPEEIAAAAGVTDIPPAPEPEPPPAVSEVVPAGPAPDLGPYLSEMAELHSGAQGLKARAETLASTLITDGQRLADDLNNIESRLAALEPSSGRTRDPAAQLEVIHAQAQVLDDALMATGYLRTDAQVFAEGVCGVAKSVRESDSRQVMDELLSGMRESLGNAESTYFRYRSHLQDATIAADRLRELAAALDSDSPGDASSADELAEIEQDIQRARTTADAVQRQLEEILLARNSAINLAASAGDVLTRANAAEGVPNESSQRSLQQIREWHDEIGTISSGIGSSHAGSQQQAGNYAEQVGGLHTRLTALQSEAGNSQANPGHPAIAEARQVAEIALAGFDFEMTYFEGIGQTLSRSKDCLSSSEQAVAVLADGMDAAQWCQQQKPGSQPDRYQSATDAAIKCVCPAGTQWDDPAGMNRCVPTEFARQECARAIPNSVPSGREGRLGEILCECRAGYGWKDDSRTECIASSDQAREEVVANTDCSGYGPNAEAIWSENWQAARCRCSGGYQWNDSKDRCIAEQAQPTREEVLQQANCTGRFGPNVEPFWDESQQTARCRCRDGFDLNADGSACVPPQNEADRQAATNQQTEASRQAEVDATDCNSYGMYSEPYWDNGRGKVLCACMQGFHWNSGTTACIADDPADFSKTDQDCRRYYKGTVAWFNPRNQDYQCGCPFGQVFDSRQLRCLPPGPGVSSSGFWPENSFGKPGRNANTTGDSSQSAGDSLMDAQGRCIYGTSQFGDCLCPDGQITLMGQCRN